MSLQRRLDVEALHRGLKASLRHGARAARLIRYCPELIEVLFPEASHPELTIYDRAVKAEDSLRQATASLGGRWDEAAEILLALKAGTVGLKLEERRRMAGALFGVDGDTFRRARWEGMLLWDIVMEVYRQTTGSEADDASL